MARFRTKLGFVHRTLWARNPAYRWAVLLGPPPLIGLLLAAGLLVALHAAKSMPRVASDVPWMHWKRPSLQEGQPFTETTAPMPPPERDGRYRNFQTGWKGAIHPLVVDAAKEVSVERMVTSVFSLEQPDIPLQRIVDAGPPDGLFVGAMQALFVIPASGIYEFSIRLTRSGTQSADCLARLGSGRRLVLSNVNVNTAGNAVLNYPPTQFRLEPGLFAVALEAGCWRGNRMVPDGDITLMVRPPGDARLRAAIAGELLVRNAPDASAR